MNDYSYSKDKLVSDKYLATPKRDQGLQNLRIPSAFTFFKEDENGVFSSSLFCSLNTDTEHGRKDFKESFNIRPEIKETVCI